MMSVDSLRHARGTLKSWRDATGRDADSPAMRRRGYPGAIVCVDAWLSNGCEDEPTDDRTNVRTVDPLALAALGRLPGMLRSKPRGSAADRETATELEEFVDTVSAGQDMLIPEVSR